jgi:hypothetical protein
VRASTIEAAARAPVSNIHNVEIASVEDGSPARWGAGMWKSGGDFIFGLSGNAVIYRLTELKLQRACALWVEMQVQDLVREGATA